MSVTAHIDQLGLKHATLERAIETENNRPHPDNGILLQLKREKLRVKDEIERLCRQPH